MEEVEGRMDRPCNEEEQATCEPLLHSTNVDANEEIAPRRGSLDSMADLDLSVVKA